MFLRTYIYCTCTNTVKLIGKDGKERNKMKEESRSEIRGVT